MADHNTLIGGISREIEGGTVRLGGVAREIESGLVLVNGVSREIVFAKPCVVTIALDGNYSASNGATSYAYVTINGKKYTSATSIEVPQGTQVVCFAKSAQSSMTTSIKLNGTTVKSGSNTSIQYTHTVTKNTRYELYAPFITPVNVGAVRIIEE